MAKTSVAAAVAVKALTDAASNNSTSVKPPARRLPRFTIDAPGA